VKIALVNGVNKIDVSMLPQHAQDDIFCKVADELFRQGKKMEALMALERGNFNMPVDVLMPIAEYCTITQKYEIAAKIYEKLGDPVMAAFIRANFKKL
jgi:hypothetical protein